MIILVYDAIEYDDKGKPTKIIFLSSEILDIATYQSILHVIDFCYNAKNGFSEELCDGRLRA